MTPSLMHKLCCPFDKHDLELKVFAKDMQQNITEGLLTCTHCKRYFPIVYGVPIMPPDEYREPALEAPILKNWKHQLDMKEPGSFRLERPDDSEK